MISSSIEKVRVSLAGKNFGYWAREISRFFSVQIVITILNFAIGFLILRALTKADYATYTAAIAILSIFTNVTNVGISPAMNAIAGKHHEDKQEMGSLVNTAISFRTRIGLFLSVPIIVYAVWQLRLLEVSWTTTILVIFIVGIGGIVQLQMTILQVPMLFARKISSLQRMELKASVLKLTAGVAAMIFLPTLLAFVTVMSLVFVYHWRLIAARAKEFYNAGAAISKEYQAEISSLFRANFLNTLYWSFQGQILILLCAIFGSTENVAEVGAMGKLTAVFMLLNLFVNSYLIPAVAKVKRPDEVLKKSLQVILIYALAAIPILFVAYLFPSLLLMILGEKYANLVDLLPLFVTISVLTLFQGALYGLCSARGWVRFYYVYTPIVIISQVGLLFMLDLSDIRDILLFDGAVVLVGILINIALYAIEFQAYRRRFASES